MSRITATFEKLRARGHKALICYFMAGDPDLSATVEAVRAARQSGADLIELGFPFSDPLADGPTIQAAAYRALQKSFTFQDYFALVSELRQEADSPIILMTYYNVVFHYGLEEFARDAQKAGLDGMIIPDLPIEESDELLNALKGTEVDLIPLAAPTTSFERVTLLSERGQGFLYYVSRLGITGAREDLPESLVDQLAGVVKASKLPVAVGFGVSKAEHARTLSKLADGVVIGSALVQRLAESPGIEEGCKRIREFLSPIAAVLHEGVSSEVAK